MKKTLFAGLIILLPIALTILVFVFLIDLFRGLRFLRSPCLLILVTRILRSNFCHSL